MNDPYVYFSRGLDLTGGDKDETVENDSASMEELAVSKAVVIIARLVYDSHIGFFFSRLKRNVKQRPKKSVKCANLKLKQNVKKQGRKYAIRYV